MQRTSKGTGVAASTRFNAIDRTSDLMERLTDAELKLLSTDLDLCMTFVRRAKSARWESTRERNRHNARRGYEDVSRALGRLHAGDALHDKLRVLRQALEEIGESFSSQPVSSRE